jgi:hypothetical protein
LCCSLTARERCARWWAQHGRLVKRFALPFVVFFAAAFTSAFVFWLASDYPHFIFA